MTLHERFRQLFSDAIKLDGTDNQYEWEISSDVYTIMQSEMIRDVADVQSKITLMGIPLKVVDILPHNTIKLWNRETNTVYVECMLM